MAIVINLSPEIETILREKATRQGRDISIVASEMLAKVIEGEVKYIEDAVAGIQRGSDNFDISRFRSFDEFVREQQCKYNLQPIYDLLD